MKKSSGQISDKIKNLPIQGLLGFSKRQFRKIEVYSFISGFELMFRHNQHSLLSWVMGISRFTGKKISKQGLDKRLSSIDPVYFKELLKRVLSQKMASCVSRLSKPGNLFDCFGRVLVQDSTCISLPSNLSTEFPGAHNRYGKSSTARIQLQLDILSETYCSIDLQSYRDNDQKHAYAILKTLKAGQLVIRDLGYWVVECFKKIDARKAFFLSRFKYGTKLRLIGQHEWMLIVEFVKLQSKKGKQSLDCQVEIGKSGKLKARLVALKAPKDVIRERKKKARKNRNKRANHSKEYYDFLTWTILITNVDQTIWPEARQVFEAYGFRWRIECVFKCWKSKMGLANFFKKHKHLNSNRVRISIYLILILITISWLKYYIFFLHKVYEKKKRFVSPFKFADFAKQNQEKLQAQKNLEELVDLVSYYCSYEVRKRKSYFKQLILGP